MDPITEHYYGKMLQPSELYMKMLVYEALKTMLLILLKKKKKIPQIL